MGKIIGDISGSKIKGTKMFEYRIYGEIPPGVDPKLIEPTIMSSVSLTGTLLPFTRHQIVLVHETTPEELAQQLAALRESTRK